LNIKPLRLIDALGLFLLISSSIFPGRELPASAKSLPKNGFVEAVYDGDTIKVNFGRGSERIVRLIGVDAAELSDIREDVLFCALMSKRFVFYHLYGRKIKLSYQWPEQDEYGRTLAFLWLEDGRLFNEVIIQEGFASVFLNFPFRSDLRKRLIEAEQEARRLNKGLWGRGNLNRVSSGEAGRYVGQLAEVRFSCASISQRKNLYVLHASGSKFEALIPEENLSLFPELSSYPKKFLTVKGFVEIYKNNIQIVIFSPSQVNVSGASPIMMRSF
jgi:micrococcal nuclease